MSDRKRTGMERFSVILTGTRDGVELFDTLDEMPAVLRATCVKALEGEQTATMVIADRAGQEAVKRSLKAIRSRGPKRSHPHPSSASPLPATHWPWRLAAELLICAAVGLAVWLAATMR